MPLSPTSRIGAARRAGRGSPAPRLVALGDLVLDIVARADEPIALGSDVAGSVRFRAGGSAANTARTFARLGGRATLICAVGRDAWGRRLVVAARTDGVTIHAVPVAHPTARLVALVGPDGDRSFVVERGAADALTATDVDEAWLRGCDVLHLPGYSLFTEPLAGAALRGAGLAHERGAFVSLDLSSRGPLLELGPRRVWKLVEGVRPSVIFGDRGEIGALAGRRGEERLLDVAGIVVVKEGAAGCRVLGRAADRPDVLRLTVATTPIAARDTTGAGDAFSAGFLLSLLSPGGRVTAGGPAPPGDRGRTGEGLPRDAGSLRRAAVAGHRAAADLLRSPRAELPDR